MSWRRGELWFDPDVLWVGERAAVPAIAGLAPPLPSLGPPPGLLASRQRREAWKRRRAARRARRTALVLSPAVVLALATLRSGGDPSSAPVPVVEPPTLPFRLGGGAGGAVDAPLRVRTPHRPLPVSKPKRAHRSVARADPEPKIEWRHATSVGLPYGGSLIDGTQLPLEGPDWVTWNPVTDSVPNAPRRLYGNDRTIRAIVSVTAAYRAAHPHAPRVVVGDISREGGGPMTDEHVSHQNGLDVDVYYPRVDRELRAPRAPDQIDHRLAQDLVDRFVAAGAQMIFVGYSTGFHGPAGVVVPYWGHDYHMHVRFPPPR
jgi:hypothetical protein